MTASHFPRGSQPVKLLGTVHEARTGGYLAIARARDPARAQPSAGWLLRRRWIVTASKFLLPVVALTLLTAVAIWPEIDRAADRGRVAMRTVGATVGGARLSQAHYNGVDQRGRPFTVTATTAIQRADERIDLSIPNADMTLENGTWINVKSKLGVYARATDQLDLSGDVVLYRDDGTTMTTATATVELKAGAASGADPTHVEGPFGNLDAAGFTTIDKGAAIQFWGPVRVELNGVTK